jgi:hypothetical protein
MEDLWMAITVLMASALWKTVRHLWVVLNEQNPDFLSCPCLQGTHYCHQCHLKFCSIIDHVRQYFHRWCFAANTSFKYPKEKVQLWIRKSVGLWNCNLTGLYGENGELGGISQVCVLAFALFNLCFWTLRLQIVFSWLCHPVEFCIHSVICVSSWILLSYTFCKNCKYLVNVCFRNNYSYRSVGQRLSKISN